MVPAQSGPTLMGAKARYPVTEITPVKPPSESVKSVLAKYPVKHRTALLSLRDLIYSVAESIEEVGEIEETLKWGEPSYLTSSSKSGTTIRFDWKSKQPDYYGVYFNCKTDLVERFKKEFKNDFTFEGNRAILFRTDEPMPIAALSKCIAAALTYHRDKNKTQPKQG